MKRISCLAIILLFCFKGALFGGGPQPVTDGMLTGVANLPMIHESFENIKLNPYAQVGYAHVGTNMTIPIEGQLVIPPGGGFQLEIGRLDLFFEDFNVWTGTVGLNAIVTPKVSLFFTALGVGPRLLPATGSVPVSTTVGGTEATITFTASKLEVWAFQTGFGYSLFPGFSLIGGFFWDHTSTALTDPRQGSDPLPNQTLRADLVAKTRIPFIGLQIQHPNYVGILSYSPLAWADVKFALRSSQTNPRELSYSWNTPGQYLAFYMQYNVTPPPMIFSLWLTGSWLAVKGPGQLEFESRSVNPPPPNLSRERETTANLGKYSLGGGISLGVTF